MYEKGDLLVSLEEAQNAALMANMSLDGWANFYGWSLKEDSGKQQDPAQPPMVGPQPAGGDSSSEDGSLDYLGRPSSLQIEIGVKTSKRQQKEQASIDAYKQQREQNLQFDPTSLDPRIQQPTASETTQGQELFVDPRFAGLGAPTLDEEVEFAIEEEDLDVDVSSTWSRVGEARNYETEDSFIKQFYLFKPDVKSAIPVERTDFTVKSKDFNKDLEQGLIEAGVDPKDFEGWLSKDKLGHDFIERVQRGDFNIKDYTGGSPFSSVTSAIKGIENLSELEQKKLLMQIELSDFLIAYKDDVNARANKQAFLREYNKNPDKYKEFSNFEDAFESYRYENGQGEIIKDVQPFLDKAFPELKKFREENRKKYLNRILDEEGNLEGLSGFEKAESTVQQLLQGGVRSITTDPALFLYSITGQHKKAAELRGQLKLQNEAQEHLTSGVYLSTGEGKKAVIDGVTYQMDDEGVVYNLDKELVANTYMPDSKLQQIAEQIEKEGERAGRSYSTSGGAVQLGGTVGMLLGQILGQKGVGLARSQVTRNALMKSNKFKDAATLNRFIRRNGNKINVNALGFKTTLKANTVDAVLFNTYYGYQQGLNSIFDQAKNAGFTEEEAYKLAHLGGRQMAVLYALTAPLNPRAPQMKALDRWLKSPDTIGKAIKSMFQAGKNPSAFLNSITNSFKNFSKSGANILKTGIGEGAAEVVQENIQQIGEYKIVNKNINEAAGEEFLKSTYSMDDFIETSILSFAAGGLMGGVSNVNTSLGYKNKLQNLHLLAKNQSALQQRLRKGVESGLYTQQEADNVTRQVQNYVNHAGKVPAYMTENANQFQEVLELYEQIDEAKKQKESLGEEFQEEVDNKINDLSNQIKQIRTEAAATAIDADIKRVKKTGVDVKVYNTVQEMQEAKDANGNPLFDNTDLQSDGLFIDADGSIIVNKEVAAKMGAVGVASHELLHRILKSQFGEITGREVEVINDLLGQLPPGLKERMIARAKAEVDGKQVYDIQFDEDGNVSGNDIDEFITFLSDEMAKGNFALTESSLKKIGRIITNFLKQVFGYNKEFTDGEQVLEFLKDYRSGIAKGRLSRAAKRKIAAGDEIQGKDKRSITPKSKAQLAKVKDAFSKLDVEQAKGSRLVEGEMYNMIATQIDNLAAKFDEETKFEFISDVYERTLKDVRNNPWDGRGQLYGYINGRIKKRILDALKADRNRVDPLYINKISSDAQAQLESELDLGTETATDAVTQEEAAPVEDKPLFKKLNAYKIKVSDTKTEGKYISNEDLPKVVRTIANIVGSKTFKSVFAQRAEEGQQSSKFINELKVALGKSIIVDVLKKKNIVKSKGGNAQQAFERFMLQNKKAILENMTTTYLQSAFPHAVEKSVSGVFVKFPNWLGQKIDREASAQGNDLVRRVPNVAKAITDEQYLEDIRTNPLKGGKEVRSAAKANSVLKAFAEEIGIEIFVEALNDTNSEIYKALVRRQGELGVTQEEISALEGMVQAERGNVKFSYTPEPGNETQIRQEFLELNGRNKTDSLLKANRADPLYFAGMKSKSPEEKKQRVDKFITDLRKGPLKAMPKKFWFPTDKGSPLLHSAKVIGVSSSDPVWKYYQDQINEIRKENNLFGEPIFDKNGNEITDFNKYINKYDTLFGSEQKILSNKDNGKIKEFNDGVGAIHEAMWSRFANLIKDDKNNITPIAQFLNFSTSNRNHWQRLGAQFVGYSEGFKSGKDNVTFEHAMPNIASYLYLLDAAINNNMVFDRAYALIVSNYKLIALDKAADNKLGGVYKTGMPKGWKVDSNYWWERYFNELVASNDNGIDPESIIMLDGRTLGEITGVQADGTVRSAKGISFDEKINQEELQQRTKELRELEAAPKKKRSVSQDENLNKEFNNILERKTGIESFKTFSDVQAEIRGRKKGKFKFFIAPAVDDFRGLVNYAFSGKGKQGEIDKQWLEDNLMTPYAKGISAIEGIRQQIKRDFKAAVKSFPKQYKLLNKTIGTSPFTYDHAVRVYLWQKAGFETIPGLSKKDTKVLQDAMQAQPELMEFANSLLAVARRDAWMPPTEHWVGGTVLSDLNGMTEKIGRKKYLEEFIANAEIIFSKENLNKIEAAFGKNHREAIEDALYSMINGTNRSTGASQNKTVGKWLNWINGSTGAIMFFNRRSALLQMLSTVNFINYSDNNPVKAAAAFANQKQYWKDFAMIFNSDKLKERRGGLQQDVSSDELASIANKNNRSPQALLARLLKLGFTPTQIADSMAIASGGATFYRNRVNTYVKGGMDQAAAEKQAFLDFSKISDETQQSSDPALVSQIQRSVLGRIVFAFQNTPMQMTRLMKKDALDLINGRGDWRVKVSRIAYYGAIQNAIFSSLQSALFALIPGFDDEDDEDLTEEELIKRNTQQEGKITRALNSMLDTLLRGSGVYGAILASAKNVIREYNKQEKKGFLGDHSYTILSLFDISPPIGSKARKINTAIKTRTFEKDAIAERGWAVTAEGRLNLGPNWSVMGNVVSATTNVPLDRVVAEVTSVAEAFNAKNTAYQRMALGAGWKTWDVGVENEVNEKIKEEAKARRKEEGVKKAAETRKRKKLEEKQAFEEATKGMSDLEKSAYIIEQKRKKKEAKKNK